MAIPVIAKGAESLFLDETRSRLLAGGAFVTILVFLAFSLVSVGIYAKQAVQILTGSVDPCEFRGPNCRALSLLSEQADLGDRVFLVESHIDSLRPDLLQCASSNAEMGDLLIAPSPDERWAYLIDRDFLYIAINTSIYPGHDEALDLGQAPEWLDYDVFYQENRFKVIHITSQDPLIQPSVMCHQVNPPAWDIVPVEQTASN